MAERLNYESYPAPQDGTNIGLGRSHFSISSSGNVVEEPVSQWKAQEKGKVTSQVDEQEISPSMTPRDSREYDLEKTSIHIGYGMSERLDNQDQMKDRSEYPRPKLPFRQRLKHFTWAWYTLTMSTGGLATLISIQPHAFTGLLTIGAILYVSNLVAFTTISSLMLARFSMHPGTLKESLKHEREGLFFPTFWLSVATMITGGQKYLLQPLEATHSMRAWMTTTIALAFWAYTVCTFLLAVIQYSFLFAHHTYRLENMMPSWLLPVFPIMLAGTIASVIAADQPIQDRIPILVTGLAAQGLGFTVSVLMYAHYIGRLMQSGLPNREHRPAMFIGVGPPSFTILALIGMANSLPADFQIVGDVTGLFLVPMIKTVAITSSLFLYALAMWFFCIAAAGTLLSRPKYFHLGWWAMVFPNSGFTIATISLGNTLKNEGVLYAGNVLTACLFAMWLFVLVFNIRAVWLTDIVYPERDEDVED